MRRSLMLLAVTAATACGGHTAAPATSAAPGPRPAPAPVGDPTTLRYGAGTSRYKIDQTVHTTQELMGNTTTADVITSFQVTMAATAGDAGNLAVTYTVDSASGGSTVNGTAVPLPVDQARGKMFRAIVAPNGQTVTFTPPDTAAITATAGDLFREFLPALPVLALTPGATWTDTSNATPNNTQGMNMHTQSIRQHRVIGWEMHDGVRALKITTVGNYSINGTGEAQGQSLQLTGTGTATVDRFLAAPGAYLGASTTDTTNMIVNVVSVGIEVPVRTSRRTSVTRLP